MAEDVILPPEPPAPEPPAPRRAARLFARIAIVVVALLLLCAALGAGGLWFVAETASGRAFVARQISAFTFESGLRYRVARIDGSLLADFRVPDLVVEDLDGRLASLADVRVRWSPLALFHGRIDIAAVDIAGGRLLRAPHIHPADPDEPFFPDINLGVGHFRLGRMILGAALLGREEAVTGEGRLDLHHQRLLFDARFRSSAADVLDLLVDAAPDHDRFALKADVEAPEGGVLAGLSGLGRAFRVHADGTGSWSKWRGAVGAEIAGSDVLRLALALDRGRFDARGTLDPAPFLPAASPPALRQEIALHLNAGPAPGTAPGTTGQGAQPTTIRAQLSSEALRFDGGGRIDLAGNRIDHATATIVARNPAAFGSEFSGGALELGLSLAGSIRRPDVRWNLKGDRLLVRGQGVARFQGNGTIDWGDGGDWGAGGDNKAGEQPPRFPFRFAATSFVNAPEAVAPLLGRPELAGVLVFGADGVAVEALRFTTTGLSLRGNARLTNPAPAAGKGTARQGRQGTAKLDAVVARLPLAGLGAIEGRAGARLSWTESGGLRGSGTIDFRLAELAPGFLADELGGPATLRGAFVLPGGDGVRVQGIELRAPKFRIREAHGAYNWRTAVFSGTAVGASSNYGTFVLMASGTSAAPEATLRMPSPGFGVTNLVAGLAPEAGGLGLEIAGDTSAGPIDARLRVEPASADRPLAVEIEHATLAGFTAAGGVKRAADGLFSGSLALDGYGLDGRAVLLEENAMQRIDVDLHALRTRLPFRTPIDIASGEGKFTLVLGADAPRLQGTVNAKGVQASGVQLGTLAGRADLRGPTGNASLTATGRTADGQSLAVETSVRSLEGGFAIAIAGSVGKQPLRLVRPAILIRSDRGWVLRPAIVRLPHGEIRVAAVLGTLGRESELRLALDDVDLGILDTVRQGLGLGGRANGQLLVRLGVGARIPSGDANIRITGLERAGVTGLTLPVDLRLGAHADDGGLKLGATIDFKGSELGRFVMTVDPGEGDTPTERFFSGHLGGGIRYQGPVEPLWALVGSEGQELKGSVAIAADFAGTPADPSLRGLSRGTGLVYRNATFGTEITDIGFDGRFTANMLQIASFSARANGGTLKGRGFVRFGQNAIVNLNVDLDKARLANSDLVEATLSGPLRVAGRRGQATISGDLVVDSARIQLVQMANSEVPQLKVRREGARPTIDDSAFSAQRTELDVRIRADDRVRVEGMGLDSTWRGDIRVRGTLQDPDLSGIATLQRGDFTFAGSDFDLNEGRVVLNGKPLDTSLDLRAQTEAADVTAIVAIGGTAGRPEIHFSSTPSLPEDEILSRLLFGTSVADLSVTEAVQLATAVAGLQSGVDSIGKIRRAVGVDRLRLVGNNQDNNGMGTALAIGKRLTRNVYVEVLTDSQGNTLTTLQLTLSRIWSLFVDVSSIGQGSANLRYQREN